MSDALSNLRSTLRRERLGELIRTERGQIALLACGLFLVLLWSYWTTLGSMVSTWSNDPQYSHGFLVPIFAGIVLWSRRAQHPNIQLSFCWWGLLILAFGSIVRLIAAACYYEFLDGYSLLPTLIGLTVLFGGWRALHWSWPALCFVVFMVPAPFRVMTALAYPLQRFATVCSAFLLQTFGQPAVAEGNVIYLREHQLEVVQACSGLGMLVTFFALSAAASLIIQRRWQEKLVVFLSAIPIALLTNVLRITLTGFLYVLAGSAVAKAVFHDLAGWLMMPMGLFLLWLELKLLDNLFIPMESSAPLSVALGTTILPPLPPSGKEVTSRESRRESAQSPRYTG